MPFLSRCLLSAGLALAVTLGPALSRDDPRAAASDTPPWGRLHVSSMILEPPDTLIWPDLLREVIEWTFPEQSAPEVIARLHRLGFSRDWTERLREEAEWATEPATSGVVVRPPASTVLALTASQRQALYLHLWNHGWGDRAFVLERGDLQLPDTSPIPERWRRFVSERALVRGGKRYFCESPLVLGALQDPAQKKAFIRSLLRTRSLVVRLLIDAPQDLQILRDYWAQGNNQRYADPFLRAVFSASPRPEAIDIIHLLPPVPRKHLNTYLRPEEQVRQDLPDCYWTALNFFEPAAVPRMLDFRSLDYYLKERYEEIEGPRRFGDVILLYEKERGTPNDSPALVHSYVHLADDIVYTKNGVSVMAPWVLMHEADMLSRYGRESMITRVLRLR